MGAIFHTVLYQPLYNAFIFLFDVLPWFDAGVLVVVFTILVKLVIFPLSRKAVSAQMELKSVEPELAAIREKYKTDKKEQAKRTMDLYKEKKINPFSGIIVVLIQLPIIFALYYVFLRSGLPKLNDGLLYSFIARPENINMNFLGLINITHKSYVLALLAGITSFFQIRFSVPAYKKSGDSGKSFKDDLAKSMNTQMRYVFPIIVLFISYSISGVVALYWTTSNLFTLGQEFVIRKKFKQKETEK
jgi:YidC/Oxa1 family membrane protein insertase